MFSVTQSSKFRLINTSCMALDVVNENILVDPKMALETSTIIIKEDKKIIYIQKLHRENKGLDFGW